jgi:molybdopterin/thiamine biosynthesis adenylyltransferase
VINTFLSPENALSLLDPYDVILDCTDNAPTRYLLSDTAVALKKPLVSGAAQKFEGQLCVYNLGEDGPCYRCLYPKPPAQHLVGTCEETGILGVVTGIIGNLQALETIKIITGLHGTHLPIIPDIGFLQVTNNGRYEAFASDLFCPRHTPIPEHQAQDPQTDLPSMWYS